MSESKLRLRINIICKLIDKLGEDDPRQDTLLNKLNHNLATLSRVEQGLL